MTLASLASDPLVLSLFDRACALVTARGQGLTLRELSTAHALAHALVTKDRERTRDLATELGIDPEALR